MGCKKGATMTKKPAGRAANATGSLAFDYANALIARRLGGNYQTQPGHSGKSHDQALRAVHHVGAKKKESAR